MRTSQLNIALVAAIFAIGTAVISKANSIGKDLITACLTNPILVTSTNSGDFNPLSESTRLDNPLNCEEVREFINHNNVFWLKSTIGLLSIPGCDPEPVEYCCIVFNKIKTQPGSIPLLTINGQAGYYRIVDIEVNVHCQP